MVEALKRIAETSRNTNNWVGDGKVRQLRQQLQQLVGSSDISALGRVTMFLAAEELKHGNEREAIRLYRQCDEQFALALTEKWPAARRRVLQNEIKFGLAIAYMRLGETENCCQRNTPDSCILPIQGEGIHAQPDGSRQAIEYLLQVLKSSQERSSVHLQARWLLNLAHMTIGTYPNGVQSEYLLPASRLLAGEPFPKFVNVARNAGVDSFSLSGGAIADDFDNDGFLDLVVSSYGPADQIRFFHNRGNGTFADRTKEAGLTGITGGLNLVQADYDNDGWTDILVLRGAWLGQRGKHPNSLLRNDGVAGAAQFTDVTLKSRLVPGNHPTQSAAWGDYDNDGDLDLYIGNEADQFDTNAPAAPCQLYRNEGNGTFTDVAKEAGVTNDRFTKAVVWGDYNNDCFPDLYLSNFLGKNRLYHNNGDGTFRDVAGDLGLLGPDNSFPAWFWDFDNDGVLDIYASSWSADIGRLCLDALGEPHGAELAALYRGDGRGGFENVAAAVGLTRPTGPMGSNFGDLDGDGFLDFYLGTGEPEFKTLMPNLMFRNLGGQRFADVTIHGGFGHLQKGHAVVFADFDNDGDRDVFEQMGGAYPGDKFYDALFENPGFGNHWIRLRLVGTTSNRSAIGARIRVRVAEPDGSEKNIYRWVNSGGSFGANPLRQTIGLGKAQKIAELEVYWPTSGKTQRWGTVAIDAAYAITEGSETLSPQ